jgi:3-deoxy-D-manno-octulosonic-acid transferase
VIYIEGDIWPSLSYLLKKQSIKQVILSAKISEKSVTRFRKLPGVFQFLYGSIDYIFAQDQTIQDRFLGLQPQKNNVEILGNLKLIRPDHEVILDKNLEMFLNLDLSKKTVVIASTHEGEEFLILEALKSHLDIMNVILVPRHPQRFEEVKKILAELKLSFRLFSKNTGEGSIYFVDAIGHLRSIYKLAHLVILGGSFVKKIGGHNVMEPIFEKVPVLVGPYAFSQKGLVSLILSHQMGAVVDICDLKGKSLEILNTSSIQENILRFLDTTTLDLDHFFKTLGPVLLQDC